MEIINYNDFKEMRWKNGGGITYEALVSPLHTSIDDEQFNFRISSAVIKSNGQFSLFNNRKRWLVILEGNQLKLNDKIFKKLIPFQFSGEEEILATLINEQVVDLGIIYNPKLVDVELHYLSLFEASTKILDLNKQNIFFTTKDTIINQKNVPKYSLIILNPSENIVFDQSKNKEHSILIFSINYIRNNRTV